MADHPRVSDRSEAERQARKLSEEIDAAAADLETNGPVPPAELRQRLLELEAEWTGQSTREPPRGKARRQPR